MSDADEPTSPRDVDQLLAGEIAKRLSLLESEDPPSGEVRAALHSLKGSAALAGHHDIALVIAQLGARVREGDRRALADAVEIFRKALARLRAGKPPLPTHWPTPPPGLGPSLIDPRFHAEYAAAVRERLSEIDVALSDDRDPRSALEQAYRSVHAMKGAAASVGDDVTAWYCHGLEAELKVWLRNERDANDALVALARHRALIALLLEEPARALETLRALSAPARRPSAAPLSRQMEADGEEHASIAFLRLSPAAVDRYLERLERIDLVHDELMAVADIARQLSTRMRNMRASLHEALRLIGPPRPWGAPQAALSRIEIAARTLHAASGSAERGAALCRRHAELLHSVTGEMRREAAELRRTTVDWLFSRVSHAVVRLAEREGRTVSVETIGEQLPIDRRTAERLLDPVLQLARNAVAHGIEPPEARTLSGKSALGTIMLRAERLGDWLRIAVVDDWRGVDVERVRELAVERGLVTSDAAPSTKDEELLGLLFTPGMTTHRSADLLAGRGVGLELVQETVRRLGGAVRLGSRPGQGLTATIEVPSERGLVEVVWLEAAGLELALPVSYARRVRRADELEKLIPLSACLGLHDNQKPKLAVELSIHGVQPVNVGVARVGWVEEVSVRGIPPLIAASGPYNGAVLRSDGSLKLALDAALLAANAWGRTS